MPNSRDRLPFRILAAYGLPGLPAAALLFPVYIFLPAFYAEDLGLGFAAVGAVLVGARFWDAFTDPVVGWASDRFSFRIGRRRAWVIGGTPLLVISAWFLFRPGDDTSIAYLLVWSMLAYLAMTMVQIPHQAWGAELSPDYAERSRITGARESFVVLGTLVAAALPAMVGSGKGDALGLLAWGVAIALPLAVLVCVLVVPDPKVEIAQRVSVKDGARVIAQNLPFRRLVAAYLLNGIANGLPATLFLLFVENVLRQDDWSGPLLLVYFLCGIAAVPVWVRLAARFDKHRVWIWAMLANSAFFLLVLFLGEGDAWWFLGICVLTGIPLGADLALPPSMQADVIDHDRAKTGKRRAGLYFALWGIATKIAFALAVGIAFPLLELAGFSEKAAAGGARDGLWALVGLYCMVPVVFKLAAIWIMRGYPITAEKHAEIRAEIEAAEG